MARTKKLLRHTTASKPAGQRARMTLGQKDRARLLALPAVHERPIDRPAAELVDEARQLEALLAQHGEPLYRQAGLSRRLVSSLPSRRQLLESAELGWATERRLALSPGEHAPAGAVERVDEAERLRRDLVAALRYFADEDEELQAWLDQLRLGSELDDLVSDLRGLAPHVERYAARLVKADLRRSVANAARQLADELERVSRAVETVRGEEALALRNRAFWHLHEAMEAAGAAGRYAYRDDARLRARFQIPSLVVSGRPRLRPTAEREAGEPARSG